MKHNIGDRVAIHRHPNASLIGVVGTVVGARVDGIYRIKPDSDPRKISGDSDTICAYSAELGRV
jgi:hypothetical protein